MIEPRGTDLGTTAKRLPNVLGLELASIIERRIIYLEMAPGSHVTEQQICDEFNVSRSPVREAFRQLESIGLVVRHTRRGVRVTPMTHEDLDEIYFCRIPLEANAAACAARHATDSDIEGLERIVIALEHSLKAAEPIRFFEHNVDFINQVHRMSRNKLLQTILVMIGKQAMRYRYFAHSYSKNMQSSSATNLRAVFEAIRSRNPDLAHKHTEKMMRDAHAGIAAVLNEYPDLASVTGDRLSAK